MSSRYLSTLAGFALLPLLCAGIVNSIVDPFQYFRISTPTRFSNAMQRHQTPGVISHYPFNAVVIGNSVAANMRGEMFSERKVQNLAMWGATMSESREVLELALRTDQVETVFWEIGAPGVLDTYRSPDFPTCMYRPIFALTPYCYLFNAGVLSESLAILLHSSGLSKATWVPYLRDWKTWDLKPMDVGAFACKLRKSLSPAQIPRMTANSMDIITPTSGLDRERFIEIVVPIVEAFPKVKFYFFVAPVYLSEMWSQAAAGVTNRSRARIKALFGRPNFIIHDFTELTEVTHDPRYYSDPHHFDFEASQKVASAFISGRSEIMSLSEHNAMLQREIKAGEELVLEQMKRSCAD